MSGFSTSDDPDLAPVKEVSAFDLIAAKLAEKRAEDDPVVRLRVNHWDSWVITYRLPATAQELAEVVKKTEKQRVKDQRAADRLILAQCCIGLQFDGVALTEDDGSPSTFASSQLRAKLGTSRATETLTEIYRGGKSDGPGDADISKHSNLLMERAGYGADDVWEETDEDPTTGH